MEQQPKDCGHAGHYTVTAKDLPLSCPMPKMVLWNAHPRVYLAIEEKKEATCPYCNTHYKLVDE